MDLSELKRHLMMGREIEFSLDAHAYFMSYLANIDPNKYYIWDEDKQSNIFEGTLDELLSFCFEDDISFIKDIDKFDFEYIL